MIRYAITDPDHYGSQPQTLLRRITHLLKNPDVTHICLRDKKSASYESLAEAFCSLRPKYREVAFFLHTDWRLALRLGADGGHLPACAFDAIAPAAEAGLRVVVSTHSPEEALSAQELGAWGVTYSPIFESPGKGEPRGLEKLKEIQAKISIDTYALGGIVSQERICALKETGVRGFASIRYFVNFTQTRRFGAEPY